MNPVLILTHNNLELTKKCVKSVLNQDVQAWPFIIDNSSNDGTLGWIASNNFIHHSLKSNLGVSYGWNCGIDDIFNAFSANHALILNNDTVLPPWFYRRLLAYDLPFVTGISTTEHYENSPEPSFAPDPIPNPDFSAFLIRREAWEKVGRFDESMVHYASDNDWHIRAHMEGITLWNSLLPFYHERSSTLKNAAAKDKKIIQLQADADREVFKEKWGCYPGDPAYRELFK